MVTKQKVNQSEPETVQDYLLQKVGFTPWGSQKPILECNKRFMLVAGGDQAGKSVGASKKLLLRWYEDNEKWDETILYWLVAIDYEGCRQEFDFIVEDFTTLFGQSAVKHTNRIDPGTIELIVPGEKRPRMKIETKSAKDPRTLRMKAPHGIVACEASQLDLETYNRMSLRVGPKRGWLYMSGSFEGSLGWYPSLWNAWRGPWPDRQSFSIKTEDNLYLFPGGADDPEILRMKTDASDDYIQERMMGLPSPPKGIVFHEIRADIHVRDIEYTPGEPVHLWIDPGYGSAAAIMVYQIIDEQVRGIDEVYEVGLVASELIQICQERPWWKDVRFGVVDAYGKQHHNMRAVAEVWSAPPPEGAGLYLSSQKVDQKEGIERFRGFLKPNPLTGEPKIVWNVKCKGILSELGLMPNPFDGQTKVYRWKTDREGNIVGDTPENKHNDGIKATIYGLVDNYGYSSVRSGGSFSVKRF